MHKLTRRTLLAAVAVGAFPQPLRAARLPRVLFVCQAGTVKSATARELMRKRARERGIGVSVVSRAIAPAEHMTPEIRQRLVREFGIDPARERPRAVRQADLDRADIAVIFDRLPPGLHKAGVLDWTGQPSLLQQFDASMACLSAHIEALLDRVAKLPA